MLSKAVRILNFDDSLLEQKNLLRQFSPTIVDLKSLGPQCRIWGNTKIFQNIKSSLNPSLRNSITFIGSGDFHHVSNILVEQFSNPLTVIVFDHHPDWDVLPPKLGCGAWVSRVLERNNIAKVILLGISSEDISSPAIYTGNVKAFEKKRLEIYPYQHSPTRFFLQKIHWQELKQANLHNFTLQLANKVPTDDIYISIDKDCLKRQYALTNWEEGCLELDELLTMLKIIKQKRNIVGLDVTGEYSPVILTSQIKKLVSRFDHPQNYSAQGHPKDFVNATNEATNLKILDCLLN